MLFAKVYILHLSNQAKILLQQGDITALKKLSYEQLLPESVRNEILQSYLSSSIDTQDGHRAPAVFTDALTLETFQEACVISSGHVMSKAQLLKHIAASKQRGVALCCPFSREKLNLTIASTNLPYVLLPKIDRYIQDYINFNALEKLPSRRFFSNKPIELADTTLHSQKNKIHIHSEELFAEQETNSGVSVASFELKVNCRRMRIRLNYKDNALSLMSVLRDVLNKNLPNSRVGESKSYSMSNESLGRCWKTVADSIIEIDCWFPQINKQDEVENKSVNTTLLTQFIKHFSNLLNFTSHDQVSLAAKPYQLSHVTSREYVTALGPVEADAPAILACVTAFFVMTKNLSDRLNISINDNVVHYQTPTRNAIHKGIGYFADGVQVLQTTGKTAVHGATL